MSKSEEEALNLFLYFGLGVILFLQNVWKWQIVSIACLSWVVYLWEESILLSSEAISV